VLLCAVSPILSFLSFHSDSSKLFPAKWNILTAPPASEAPPKKKKTPKTEPEAQPDPWYAKIVYLYEDEVRTVSTQLGLQTYRFQTVRRANGSLSMV
jgi:hypothetical protein